MSGDSGSRGCPLLEALQHKELQDFLKEEDLEILIPLMHAIKTEFIPEVLLQAVQAAKQQRTFEHHLEYS